MEKFIWFYDEYVPGDYDAPTNRAFIGTLDEFVATYRTISIFPAMTRAFPLWCIGSNFTPRFDMVVCALEKCERVSFWTDARKHRFGRR